MEILAARVLIRSADPERALRFYRDVLGLAIHREFPGGTVFFLGGGYLEVSCHAEPGSAADGVQLWLQVRDVTVAEKDLAAAGATILRSAQVEPWGLKELWIADPDGVKIVMVEVPAGHPMRTDLRGLGVPAHQ
jgi:catechol 2,3-dioxygenase-like lactoylglutathione lyase family enzyme